MLYKIVIKTFYAIRINSSMGDLFFVREILCFFCNYFTFMLALLNWSR